MRLIDYVAIPLVVYLNINYYDFIIHLESGEPKRKDQSQIVGEYRNLLEIGFQF